jgi:co-chaperonin GroES (HSP10)
MKLKAINNWVFVRRDAQETTHFGLEISDEAQVKNMLGEIVSIGNEDIAKPGQRIHIPHYQVDDYEIQGEEMAVMKDDLLFAIEEDADFIPINRYVKVRKCINDHIRDYDGNLVLYQTEKFIESTHFVEIIAIADDCKTLTSDHIGDVCIAPENDDRLQRLLYSKDYMIHEDLIKFTTDGD